VALVEPSAARAGLLRVAVAALGLRNAEVIARRAEDVAGEIEAGGRAPADAAVARAVLPPDEWLALGCRLVRRGGAVVVLGGETWPGPADRPDLRVDVRHQYRLRGGQPRCAWRIIVE
jgi:16S rRNA G527 N7-methylase RsmG